MSGQDVTSREVLSPKADALNQALKRFMDNLDFYTEPDLSEVIPMLARVFVEELGITEANTAASTCSLEAQANAQKLRTLLELAAEVKHGE